MIAKLLAVFLLVAAGLARAETLVVRSPDHAQTHAFSSILERRLRQFPKSGVLAASITFSNVGYYSRIERREDERFDFTFPGVRFDAAAGLFYLATRGGGGPAPIRVRR